MHDVEYFTISNQCCIVVKSRTSDSEVAGSIANRIA